MPSWYPEIFSAPPKVRLRTSIFTRQRHAMMLCSGTFSKSHLNRSEPEFTEDSLTRIHASSLIKIEKILNRPITKFYNSDDVNVIPAELGLIKTKPTSLHKRHNLL